MGLVFGAMLLGLYLGVPLAVEQVLGPRWVRKAAGIYVWLFRGVPILVQLNLFYFGILAYLAKQTWRNIVVFVALGLSYLLLVTLATLLLRWIKRRITLPGFEQAKD